MVIRNRTLAFIYHSLGTILGIVTLVFIVNTYTVNSQFWNPFRYFGSWVSAYTSFVFLAESILCGFALKNRKHRKSNPQVFGQMLYLATCLEIVIAFARPICYLFINGGNIAAPYFSKDQTVTNVLTYIALPATTFFDWFLFSEKGNWKWHWIIYLIALPAMYLAFSILNRGIRQATTFATMIFDNNTYLNYAILGERDGWVGVVISSCTILILFVSVGIFMVFLSYLLSGKYAKKPTSSDLL